MNMKNLSFAILVGILASALIVNAGYIGDLATVMMHQKYSIYPYSYVIEPFNSTFYQSTNASGYVYQSTSVSSVFQNVLGNCSNGGVIFFKEGVYNFTSDVILPSGLRNRHLTIEGAGKWGEWSDPFATGGTVLLFYNCQFLNGTIPDQYFYVDLKNLGVWFSGDFRTRTIPIWDFHKVMISCENVAIGTNAYFDSSSTFMYMGTSGASASPMVWNRMSFYDGRKSGNYSYFVRWAFESFKLSDSSVILDFANNAGNASWPYLFDMGLTNSFSEVNHFDIYSTTGFDAGSTDYKYQFMCSVNTLFNDVQFIPTAHIGVAHLCSVGGNVTLMNTFIEEAGNAIYVPTIYGTPAQLVCLGIGFQNSGSANNATATTFTITHGLAGTPTGVWCSFNYTTGTFYKWTATATTITVTLSTSTPDSTIACYWSAIYKP